MEEYLIRYFTAEKQESLIFMIVGISALLISLYLLKSDSSYKGMIYPLIFVAIIQLVVGGTVFFRTNGQVATLKIQLNDSPVHYKTDEVARMNTVMKNFKIYKSIEIILLLAGIILTFIVRDRNFWYSVGVGLIIQSSFMLVLDLFAEKRGLEYLNKLTDFVF